MRLTPSACLLGLALILSRPAPACARPLPSARAARVASAAGLRGGAAAAGGPAQDARTDMRSAAQSCGPSAQDEGPPTVRCVIFDFDSTISAPQYLERFGKWAIADKAEIMLSMSHEEIVSNFGGQERLAQLQRMLQCLSDRGTHLLIISLGRTECIAAHLKAVNLLRYFPSEHIYGRDSPDLRKHRCGGLFCKALLILELMTRASWLPHEVCFKLLFAPRSLLSPALPPRPLSLSLSGSGVVWACV